MKKPFVPFFSHCDRLELNSCLHLNSYCQRLLIRRFFVTVSRLGDGIFWYTCLLALPILFGLHGLQASAVIALTAVACTLFYKSLKGSLVRTRPFLNSADILCATPPLDRYSFPSGHTMHAVCFSVMLIGFYPPAAILLLPFTAAVALSRVVLGLHYPSDVVIGALLGWLIAETGIALAASTFVY